MIKQIVFLVLAISCVSANLSFTDCGSTATVHALRIQGCAAAPCVFRRGQQYVIEMDVTVSKYTELFDDFSLCKRQQPKMLLIKKKS